MKRLNLNTLTVGELVERFAAIGIEEDQAANAGNIAKCNRYRSQMSEIKKELKSRPGDQRTALLKLLVHPNMGIRLLAAKATLAVAPTEARRVIESIAASYQLIYAGDANMCLYMLDCGGYVPK